MRLYTSKQINRIRKKSHEHGLRVGFDIGYKRGWADKRYGKPELDPVVVSELEDILGGVD